MKVLGRLSVISNKCGVKALYIKEGGGGGSFESKDWTDMLQMLARAEWSRAEWSRAEWSRAEWSSCVVTGGLLTLH